MGLRIGTLEALGVSGPARNAASSARTAANWLERTVPNRAVRFVLTGGFNSVFSYAVFAALQLTLGLVVHYLIVLVVATAIAIVEAYVMQRWLVWRVRGRWWAELVRFSGVYLVVLVVNMGLLPLLHEVGGLPVLLAQALIMVVNACGTFVIHRSFTFRKSLQGGSTGRPASRS